MKKNVENQQLKGKLSAYRMSQKKYIAKKTVE